MTKKFTAIVKMKPSFSPPQHLIRSHIAGQIWTVEGTQDEMGQLETSCDVVSLQRSAPLPSLYSDGDQTRPPEAP